MVYLQQRNIQIHTSLDVARVFIDLLALEDEIDREREHFYVMHLDVKQRVKLVELVAIGTLEAALVTPREVYRRAVMAGAKSIIVAHNHPSGVCEPSDEDTKVTKLLFEAGQILGISLLDHIVFCKRAFFSFKENNTQALTGKKPQTRGEVKNV